MYETAFGLNPPTFRILNPFRADPGRYYLLRVLQAEKGQQYEAGFKYRVSDTAVPSMPPSSTSRERTVWRPVGRSAILDPGWRGLQIRGLELGIYRQHHADSRHHGVPTPISTRWSRRKATLSAAASIVFHRFTLLRWLGQAETDACSGMPGFQRRRWVCAISVKHPGRPVCLR